MTDIISSLSLDQEQRIDAEKEAEHLSSISETLSTLAEKVKSSGDIQHLGKIVPWLGHTIDVAGEALPAIKAVAKFLEKATEITDARDQGMIACRAAYQQACVEAFFFVGKPRAAIAFSSEEALLQTKVKLKTDLAALETRDAEFLENFLLPWCSAATSPPDLNPPGVRRVFKAKYPTYWKVFGLCERPGSGFAWTCFPPAGLASAGYLGPENYPLADCTKSP